MSIQFLSEIAKQLVFFLLLCVFYDSFQTKLKKIVTYRGVSNSSLNDFLDVAIWVLFCTSCPPPLPPSEKKIKLWIRKKRKRFVNSYDCLQKSLKNVIYSAVFYVYYEMNCIHLTCFSDTVLAPNITKLTSTTSKISVYWSHPHTLYYLVSNYEVTWKVNGSSVETSGLLERTAKEYTISRYLMAGQLYIVNVICHTDRSNPSSPTAVPSDDASIRLSINYDIIVIVTVINFIAIYLVFSIQLQTVPTYCFPEILTITFKNYTHL